MEGDFFLVIGDYSFPIQEWRDFVCPIIQWRVGAFKELLRNNENQIALPFMEWPFEVNVEYVQSKLEMSFSKNENLDHGAEVEIYTFGRRLLTVVDGIVEFYSINSYGGIKFWEFFATGLDMDLVGLKN